MGFIMVRLIGRINFTSLEKVKCEERRRKAAKAGEECQTKTDE